MGSLLHSFLSSFQGNLTSEKESSGVKLAFNYCWCCYLLPSQVGLATDVRDKGPSGSLHITYYHLQVALLSNLPPRNVITTIYYSLYISTTPPPLLQCWLLTMTKANRKKKVINAEREHWQLAPSGIYFCALKIRRYSIWLLKEQYFYVL